jgi:acyl-CoA dehydrogenase
LTPISKAYGTDTGCDVAHMGVQVHGGMGYIEDTGAAQYLRDVRVTAIYEGTNGIQAMDLVGRKLADRGDAAFRLIDEVQAHAELCRKTDSTLAGDVWSAAEALREATEQLLTLDTTARFAVAVPYLRAFARILAAHFHLSAAQADAARLPLAQFMIKRMLPQYTGLLAQVSQGAQGFDMLTPEVLGA